MRKAWIALLLLAMISALQGWRIPALLIAAVLGGLALWSLLQRMLIHFRDAHTESPLERMLAAELDRREIPYVREHRISRISVDFAFPAAKLAVECDGWRYHHMHRERDARRDAFLRRNGWRVLRFSGQQLKADVRHCAQQIADRL